MNKKLKRYTKEDLNRAFSTNGTPPIGAKGTQSNPYTVAESEVML